MAGPYVYTESDLGSGLRFRHPNTAALPYKNNMFRYWNNSAWNLFATWEPDGTKGVDQPASPWNCCVWFPGGQNISHVGASATSGYMPLTGGTGTGTLFEEATLNVSTGCALVSVERTPGSRLNENLDVQDTADVFERIKEVQMLLRHLKENHDNPEYWGPGNSINPDGIIPMGNSQGAYDIAMSQYMPPLYDMGGFGSGNSDFMPLDHWGPRWYNSNDHVAAAMYLDEPFTDTTQVSNEAVVQPGPSGLAQMHSFFWNHQDWFGRFSDSRQFVDSIPRAILYCMSMYHWVNTFGNQHIKEVPQLSIWDGTADAWVFNHGVPDPNLEDPHSVVQGLPWYNLLANKGIVDQSVLFANQLSEVWLPLAAGGTGGTTGSQTAPGELLTGTNTKISIFRDWMDNKILPTL